MADEFDGHGGSYLIDGKTGARKLVERTAEPTKDEAPATGAPDAPEE